MKTSSKRERLSSRRGILANFQFYVDEDTTKICEGVTLNISDRGFGFLTEAEIRKGQTITVTRHALHGFSSSKAKVVWVSRGPNCMEAGAEFHPGN